MVKTEEQLLEILKSKSNFGLQFVQAKTDYRELADEIKSSSRTIYRLLNKLESEGLVKKLENGLILVKTSGDFLSKPKAPMTLEPSVSSCENFIKLLEADFIKATDPSAKKFLMFFKNNNFNSKLNVFVDAFLTKNHSNQLKNKYTYFIKSWQTWKSQPMTAPSSLNNTFSWAQKVIDELN